MEGKLEVTNPIMNIKTKIVSTYKTIDIAAGSIIMAIGIFLLGAIHQFPLLDEHFGRYFSAILVIVWLLLLFSFCFSLFIREYQNSLVSSPIKSFAAGTWIAGTSVVGIIMIHYFPVLTTGLTILLYMNVFLWFIYILFCIWQFKKIIGIGSIKDVHGLVLLSTVSTQSIACLLINYYQESISANIIFYLISIGIVFYVFSIILIGIRFSSKWFDIHEWKNTDCIIHGALSITGLAMTQSRQFETDMLLVVWWVVFSIFVIVEMIEIIRGINRIKKLGWKKGIFTYHISQWARNFTFGMFYYFTYNLVNMMGKDLLNFQTEVMYVLGWIILIILVTEIALLLSTIILKNMNGIESGALR